MGHSNEAAALRGTLECPIYNKVLHKEVGRGELDYEVYVRTRELLALQTPTDELVIPDELLFLVMHQTQELWLKCAVFEATNLVEHLDGRPAVRRPGVARPRGSHRPDPARSDPRAGHAVAVAVPDHPAQPRQRQRPRIARLQPAARRGSGRGRRARPPDRAPRHDAARRLSRIRRITPDLHRIAERFVDWDSSFQTWLVEHFMLVRRTMGIDKTVRALDGFPTVALGGRMTKPLFAELWNVRVEMTQAWSREGGFAPGEQRCPYAAAGRSARGGMRWCRIESSARRVPSPRDLRVPEQQLHRRHCRGERRRRSTRTGAPSSAGATRRGTGGGTT